MRRVISLIAATALTGAGAVLCYWEATAPGHLPYRVWWTGPFMALAGVLWLLDDLRKKKE
jgi:hypothetical protein